MHEDRGRRETRGLLALPVAPYIGLTMAQARDRAAGEGRHVVDRTGVLQRRADLQYGRVNVVVDDSGHVVSADAG